MKRILSITLDDEEKTICIENQYDFSVIELLGLASDLFIRAAIHDAKVIETARKNAAKEAADEQPAAEESED